jgi:hypothetical protein
MLERNGVRNYPEGRGEGWGMWDCFSSLGLYVGRYADKNIPHRG